MPIHPGRDRYEAAAQQVATLALDVSELLPEVHWPAQIELRAGRYVVLHYQRGHPLPREITLNEQLPNRFLLDAAGFNQAPWPGFQCSYDVLPSADCWQRLPCGTRNRTRNQRKLRAIACGQLDRRISANGLAMK